MKMDMKSEMKTEMNTVELNPAAAASNHNVVNLSGRLDAVSVARKKVDLIKQVTTSGTNTVLNLSEVDFIDSTGLGFLVSMHKTLEADGRQLAVCELSEQARLLFELTRLNQIFDIYDSETLAVQALS